MIMIKYYKNIYNIVNGFIDLLHFTGRVYLNRKIVEVRIYIIFI